MAPIVGVLSSHTQEVSKERLASIELELKKLKNQHKIMTDLNDSYEHEIQTLKDLIDKMDAEQRAFASEKSTIVEENRMLKERRVALEHSVASVEAQVYVVWFGS